MEATLSVLSLIDGYKDVNAWEEGCIKCYHIRYQSEHYTEIPAVHEGDAGIEGFTDSGVVHQCYRPMREYHDDSLFDHQRNKLTEDINKLLKNGKKLHKLGVPPIREWHFVCPEYRDSRIIEHAAKKEREVIKAKTEDPIAYKHISEDFKIFIMSADNFLLELSQLLRTNLTDMKLNLTIHQSLPPEWNKCDSEKVSNITRKVEAVMKEYNTESSKKIVSIYIEHYLKGLFILNELRISYPEVYKDLIDLECICREDVILKTNMNKSPDNNTLFWEIIYNFEEKLSKDFSNKLTYASIGELRQDIIASWLADCSMEFRN